ncbi:MAG: ThiF family adenylyltransferase [Thermomicrobiales bacterium]
MNGLTAKEFYQRRDDRTDRVTASRDYHRLHSRIVAAPETVRTFAGQVQLLLAANLLARWCRRVEFGFSDAPLAERLRVGDATTLHARIAAEVHQADPFGAFSFAAARSPNVRYTLKVGGHSVGESVDFSIDAGAWDVRAGVGNRVFGPTETGDNPVGPAFAACVGVADAFKVATGLPGHFRVRDLTLCLFDLHLGGIACSAAVPLVHAPLKMGNAQIVGLGSVGSAVAYLLGMLPVEGLIWLIDHDHVKIENLNRSPLFGVADIGYPKVEVAHRHLRHAVPTAPFPGRYGEFIDEYGRKPGDIDLILPLANEFGVRATIEYNFPPLQIYGTTAASGVVNYHRHIPLSEDCSLCRFPISAEEAEARLLCSVASVATALGEQIDAALPFVSTAAASLVVADLMRVQMPNYPFLPNFADIDMLGPLEFIASYQRRPRPECLCASRSPAIHRNYIHPTAFSGTL